MRNAEGWVERYFEDFKVGGEVCVTFRRTAMIHRRGADEAAVPFPDVATPIDEAFAAR